MTAGSHAMASHIFILIAIKGDLSTPEEKDTGAKRPETEMDKVVAASQRRQQEEYGWGGVRT